MKPTTLVLAAALSLSGTVAFAQGGMNAGSGAGEQGAPTAASPNSRGDRTQPGAVRSGNSPTTAAPPMNREGGVTTGSATRQPKGASEQGAPTEPGAVKGGNSR